MKKIIIIGAGGHAKVIADIIIKRKKKLKENIIIEAFLDDKYETKKTVYQGIPLIGKLDKINNLNKDDYYFVIAIGNNAIREKIANKYDLKYYTAVHPDAILAEDVEIGEGTAVMANAVINSSVKVGSHCIINTSSVIEHDNEIDAFAHVSPNAVLAGNVKVGKKSWIGMGTSVVQGVKIGDNVTIGAGSVVLNDIVNDVTAYGVPCRERY
ncbi:acetyltransferase [Halanaerobium congolense]|uniref:Sugar O-acyltransferase, sialic acid O-acetyltransferase NeuD family n=1 Tax=Halanaerobium congolense TaxID=54121 RepID=A0A1G6MSD5_9FIRM|nr:acetyltransferase [Halanaerobium congolense]PUU87761.1 MAG: sugar O-acyltransferase, sialic acid O-acetyltransferase NeuD family [Halanaerobium sp.]SDC58460.1 sugar O-acyltransferase, sialic acid O-acetyltransferase NeuD family [Halanaerobium congolense]